jgi:tryptophan synthase alpha chain
VSDLPNNCIDARMANRDGAALILYLTAGHPDLHSSLSLVPEMARLGDIVEIGIPFSDPVADGPIIQQSTQDALANGTTMADSFRVASHTREKSETPIVLLTYYNPVLHHGLEAFARDSRAAGVDGVICADLPAEEAAPLYRALTAQGIHLIPMIAPTSTDERIERACKLGGGFVYCVSRMGVTGLRDAMNRDLPEFLARVRRFTDLPRAVGFGVSNAEHARAVAGLAEGVIIGSALVDLVARTPAQERLAAAMKFVASIRAGMATHA